MELLYVIFAIVAVGTLAGWIVTLYKFYPLYKAGHYTSFYNWLLAALVALLLWETAALVALPGFRSVWLATMLTVLWAIGVIAWLTMATLARTTRQVRSETAQAMPQAQPSVAPAQGYKVRTRPHVQAAAGAPRSSRVRRIQAMEA